ncbi:MAG: glycosyltransferase family 2 protein [Candidatus Bathyarchaeota archaeon]|nr:glycosyltransferase family 2 protein [Candidatus Bathyarchaeota archaeon]
MKDNRTPLVSVIVPVFNEEEIIGVTLERTLQLRGKLNLEVIVVDDGSTDQTREIVKDFEDVNLICHEKNCGKGGAIVTGMLSSRGDIIIIQDADLEYLPEDIPKLIDPILQGRADFVFGSRFLGTIKEMSRSHRVGNMILSLAARLLYNAPITDVMTGHKAFSRRSLKTVKLSERGFGVEVELTAKFLGNGWKLAEVPISYVYRNKGRSKITYIDGLKCLVKLLKLRISPSAR